MVHRIASQALRSVAAFGVCFAVGASGSVLLGLEAHIWVPAGIATSTTASARADFG